MASTDAIRRFREMGGISLQMTRNLDMDRFKTVMMDGDVVSALDDVLKQLVQECRLRRGAPVEEEGPMPLRSGILVHAYTIAGYHAIGNADDDPLGYRLASSARVVACLFDRIMDAVDDSFATLPMNVSNLFLDIIFDFSATFELWAVLDTHRLLQRVKRALEALYSAMTLISDEPELLAHFDLQIVRLRAQMVLMDPASRDFLAPEEMSRMLRIVSSRPLVLGLFACVQRRIRLIRGLEESEPIRRKLVAFRQCAEMRFFPHELFVLVARRVLGRPPYSH